MKISGPGIPNTPFEDSVPDTYRFVSMYNGRPAYKAMSRGLYLFFIEESPARWVIEPEIGGEVAGYIRHEGNVACPEYVGTSWTQAWNSTVVDPRITVQCSGTLKF